jgi:hypothetical protein
MKKCFEYWVGLYELCMFVAPTVFHMWCNSIRHGPWLGLEKLSGELVVIHIIDFTQVDNVAVFESNMEPLEKLNQCGGKAACSIELSNKTLH